MRFMKRLAVSIAVVFMFEACDDPQRLPTSCDKVAIHGGYYADPVTRLCGVHMGGIAHVSADSCPGVLALRQFREVKKCWKAPIVILTSDRDDAGVR